MGKLDQLNEYVLVMITSYLSNNDRLALAYSSSILYRLSISSMYWHHGTSTASDLIPRRFLPAKHPQGTKYTGTEYRQALLRKHTFQRNWQSEYPQAKAYAVISAGSDVDLRLIPGSRWLMGCNWYPDFVSNDVQFCFFDGLTGAIIEPFFCLDTGFHESAKHPPVVYARADNEILLGCQCPNPPTAVNNRTEPSSCKYDYQIISVSFEETQWVDHPLIIEPMPSPFYILKKLPFFNKWILNEKFTALYREGTSLSESYFIEFKSGENLDLEYGYNKPILCQEFMDDYLITVVQSGAPEIVSIHIPSLLSQYPPVSGHKRHRIPLPAGLDIAESRVNLLEFASTRAYSTSVSRAPPTPREFGPGPIFDSLENTFVLLVEQESQYWPIRFHMAISEGITNSAQLCDPHCQVCAFNNPLVRPAREDSSIRVPPYSPGSDAAWRTAARGSEITSTCASMEGISVMYAQASGQDFPIQPRKLELQSCSLSKDAWTRSTDPSEEEEVPARGVAAQVDGITGMVLEKSVEYQGDFGYDHTLYYF